MRKQWVAAGGVEYDREKAGIYAAAGGKHYWIVMINEMQLELFGAPGATGSGRREVRGLGEDTAAPVGNLSINVRAIVQNG